MYIDEALKPIERQGFRAMNDVYHQPKRSATRKPAYDPHCLLKGCITTSGSDSYHYSGERLWTPRELSLFQTFPYGYQFSGSKTAATKQIGNAFPPIMAEAMFRVCIQTLDAFEADLITAEDDLTTVDLDALLRSNGASRRERQQPQTPRSYFNTPARSMTLPLRQSASRVSRSLATARPTLRARYSSSADESWTDVGQRRAAQNTRNQEVIVIDDDDDGSESDDEVICLSD